MLLHEMMFLSFFVPHFFPIQGLRQNVPQAWLSALCQQASTPMYTRMNGCCACLSQLGVESFNRSANCLCFLQDMTSEVVSQNRYPTYGIQRCYHSDIYKRITETGSWCTVPSNLQSFPSFQPAISLLTIRPLVVVQWKSKEWPEWLF